jgi:hypothetical protein
VTAAKRQIDLPTAIQKLSETYAPTPHYGKSEDYRACKFFYQVRMDSAGAPTSAELVLHVVKEWATPEEKISISLAQNDFIFLEGTDKNFTIRRAETSKDGVFEHKKSIHIEPNKAGGNTVAFYNSHPQGGQPSSLTCRFK